MKIFNIKINLRKLGYMFIFLIIILLFVFLIYLFSNNSTIYMNADNYTTILRDSHNEISKYVGKKIITSGYVFRGKDFKKEQFVIARDMLINESEANIVGFLCDYDYANEFENNVWVEVHGTIALGDYYGPIPIIKINTIKRITTPESTFVYPPN